LAKFAEKKIEHPKDSLQLSIESAERLQGRTDKKFEHPNLPKGEVLKVEVLGPTEKEQLDPLFGKLNKGLTDRLPDLPPTGDPLLKRLREWQPERK
jgi:hypothetical protein